MENGKRAIDLDWQKKKTLLEHYAFFVLLYVLRFFSDFFFFSQLFSYFGCLTTECTVD